MTDLLPSLRLLYAAALVVAVVACVTDLRVRRIPNVLTFGAAAGALALRVALDGPVALVGGALGWMVGIGMLLPLFALRGMGGGDVKLLAALGAFVGPRLVLWTGLYGAIAGGLLAVVVTVWGGVFRRTLANVGGMVTYWRVAGIGPIAGMTLETASSPRLPYAVPLACGLVVALWLKA